ncbi:hypothetical protein F4860DRAFT_57748 [Xylaria cubensis]|nr:hypothetical protein F4860DRAFT_57748 [Xylaria cubensis]
MDQTLAKTDPDTGEVLSLLYYFNAPTHDSFLHIELDNDSFLHVELDTRKWCDFSERQTLDHRNNTLLPGALERLPPELRFMIYDFTMRPGRWCFESRVASSEFPEQLEIPLHFGFPTIAHVCREMRQYTMQKYPFFRVRCHDTRRELRGCGVFNPAHDAFTIGLHFLDSVYWTQDLSVQWRTRSDGRRCPQIRKISSKVSGT